jgi:hypothetical protein
MQSQQATNATVNQSLTSGAALKAYAANATVLPGIDLIKATGGAGGITLTLTAGITPTGNPAAPDFLYQVYYARRDDAGAGAVVFVDSKGALFNGQASWELLDQYQWAIFIWDGTGWNVIGN